MLTENCILMNRCSFDLCMSISGISKFIVSRKILAKSIASSEILKLIDSGLDFSRKRISNIEIDKSALNSKALESLSHLNKATSGNSSQINPFLGLCLGDEVLQGQQSRLQISLLKKPLNTEYEYIARSWFDDVEAEVKPISGNFYSQSIALTQGPHIWKVKTYMVNKKIYRSLLANIELAKKQIIQLQDKYDTETDANLKQQALINLNKKKNLLVQLKTEKTAEEKEISNQIDLDFEVL
jgi:hypothetical protein